MIRSRSSPLNKPLLLGLLLAVALPSQHSRAQELGEGLQAHGFISQSVVHTSDNRVGGRSDDSLGWNLREMGANLSWRPSPDWLLSGQMLARWAGQADEGDIRLDYGFVDRVLFSDGDSQIGARLGKIKNPYGFFNATRDVAHTRPGIIMPQSIYLDQIRNFFLAAPGMALYGNSEFQSGNLSWQISLLRPEVDDANLEYIFILGDQPGKFRGRNSWLGQAMFDMGGEWKMGLSLGQMNMSYKPAPVDVDVPGKHNLPTWVFSLEHNTEDWSVTAEYGRTGVKAKGFINFNTDHWSEAGYVQLTRRFSPGWHAYLRYDVMYYDKDDKDGTIFSTNLGGLVPPYSLYAKDWVLGVRKDLDRLALSAEVHVVDGTGWLAQVENPALSQTRKWNMLLLQAAWRF